MSSIVLLLQLLAWCIVQWMNSPVLQRKMQCNLDNCDRISKNTPQILPLWFNNKKNWNFCTSRPGIRPSDINDEFTTRRCGCNGERVHQSTHHACNFFPTIRKDFHHNAPNSTCIQLFFLLTNARRNLKKLRSPIMIACQPRRADC